MPPIVKAATIMPTAVPATTTAIAASICLMLNRIRGFLCALLSKMRRPLFLFPPSLRISLFDGTCAGY
jgi:hypothetical protein